MVRQVFSYQFPVEYKKIQAAGGWFCRIPKATVGTVNMLVKSFLISFDSVEKLKIHRAGSGGFLVSSTGLRQAGML
jgi:hypothetical protein